MTLELEELDIAIRHLNYTAKNFECHRQIVMSERQHCHKGVTALNFVVSYQYQNISICHSG